MKTDLFDIDLVELQAALMELQAASWARSWSRVKKARKRVKEILKVDVPGPLIQLVKFERRESRIHQTSDADSPSK